VGSHARKNCEGFSHEERAEVDSIAFGYRFGEVSLPKLPILKQKTKFKVRPVQVKKRVPVMISAVETKWAPVHPDNFHGPTLLAGVQKRFAREPPAPEPLHMEAFGSFVDRFLLANLTPIPMDADVSVETWLDKTNYTLARKTQLLSVKTDLDKLKDEDTIVKLFMKDETYPSYKHGRGINSRQDSFKTAVGPIFKLIEERVFKLPYFIKKIPVVDRPKFIYDKLYRSGSKYAASDYTTYEALFTKELMQQVDFKLFAYMTQFIINGQLFSDVVEDVLGGTNVIQNKFFTMLIEATRMSGEMCTSLANGFANLMFMLYMLEISGCTDVDGVVEGDDGLFVFNGVPPTPKDFEVLGLDIKLEIHNDLESASFCGLIFDKYDLQNVTDPIQALLAFTWLNFRYINASANTKMLLLRAKALSYGWQYPGCPIISALSRWGLRISSHIRHAIDYMKNSGAISDYDRNEFIQNVHGNSVPFVDIGINTRFLVEKKYGINVSEQLRIEEYLDNFGAGQIFDPPFLDMFSNGDTRDYSFNYLVRDNPSCLKPFARLSSERSSCELRENSKSASIGVGNSGFGNPHSDFV
jgi:hypothetical protein